MGKARGAASSFQGNTVKIPSPPLVEGSEANGALDGKAPHLDGGHFGPPQPRLLKKDMRYLST